MANEIRVQTSLSIRSGSLDYQSRPTAFAADLATPNGPTPGAFPVSVHGTLVDFSKLGSYGGMMRMQNQDPTNFVTVGAYDGATGKFFAMFDLKPGESYVNRLSTLFGRDYGTGTGTAGVGLADGMMVKANTAACVVLVEAFDP